MRSYAISLLLAISAALPALAMERTDSLAREDSVRFLADLAAADSEIYVQPSPQQSRRDRRVHRYRRHWASLIPTHTIAQYAGNMGLVSAGIGWDHGRHRQWETALMAGYLPKFNSCRGKMTVTLKETFLPWYFYLRNGWTLEPLSCGLYVNTVLGHEFWGRQPSRYPHQYYPFLSTRVRFNAFLGQRLGLIVPRSKRKLVKSVTLFYEVSSCDLYIRSFVQDSDVRLWDILSLSFGVKFQLL